MIADDQQLIRDSLKIILEANKDFSVTDTVANGQEVLELSLIHISEPTRPY